MYPSKHFWRPPTRWLVDRRVAAVNHDKDGLGIARIAQNALQIHDTAFGEIEIIANTHGRMNVYWEAKPAALNEQVTEQKILESPVFRFARDASVNESSINFLRLVASRIGELGERK